MYLGGVLFNVAQKHKLYEFSCASSTVIMGLLPKGLVNVICKSIYSKVK